MPKQPLPIVLYVLSHDGEFYLFGNQRPVGREEGGHHRVPASPDKYHRSDNGPTAMISCAGTPSHREQTISPLVIERRWTCAFAR